MLYVLLVIDISEFVIIKIRRTSSTCMFQSATLIVSVSISELSFFVTLCIHFRFVVTLIFLNHFFWEFKFMSYVEFIYLPLMHMYFESKTSSLEISKIYFRFRTYPCNSCLGLWTSIKVCPISKCFITGQTTISTMNPQ